MSTRNCSAVATLALCTLFIAAVASAQTPAAGSFPSFTAFNGALAEFPEGVAADKDGNVYVSIRQSPFGPLASLTDQVWKFSPAGVKSILADFGPPGGGACGLALDADGNVYMARTPSAAPYNGVYRVGTDGSVALIPGTQNIAYADGLAFDKKGNLYITEVFSVDPASGAFAQGGIWRLAKGGTTAALWLRDDLLTGLAPTLFPFPIGANGIAFYRGDLYVINTDKALVVRVAVLPDGSPGQPEIWKQVQDVPESVFYQSPYFPLMLDGLALDVHGNVYIATPSRLAVVCIDADDRSQETIAVFPDAPLDAPFSLAFGAATGERENLFITNSGITGFLAPGSWPGPGLVKLEIGVPGLPLP